MEDRNPSPPPDFEKDPEVYLPDSVGDTAISKHWVLTTLMDLINEVKKHSGTEGDGPLDVSDDIQDSTCKLWDLCMDEDVAVFLLDFNIVDILYDVIMKSKSPRITEISVGILGNMVCSPKACEAISKSANVRSVLLALLASSDTQILIELVRLLRVCLSNNSCSNLWIETIEASVDDFLQNALFIFSSSTNGKLLRSLSEVFDQIYEVNSELLKSSCSKEFVGALLEAVDQITKEDPMSSMHLVCHSLHALHNISLADEGKQAIGDLRRDTLALLSSLCEQWMTIHPKVEYNNSTEMSSSEVSVSCCLSISSHLLFADAKTKRDADNKENVNKTQDVDDEDREIILRFARCIVSAKGVLSALSKMPSVMNNNEEHDEFKTPLHLVRDSPRNTTPLLSQESKASGSRSTCTTPVSSCTLAPPDRTPDTVNDCGDRTPPTGLTSPDVDSPIKRPSAIGSERRGHPAVMLSDLAKELLEGVKPSANGDASPDDAEK